MFDDRVEVVSPGGLPSGITAEEYLSGKLSVLRNRNLANVFYRLGFDEIFGTGITRIKQLYAEGLMKPDFEVSENAIKIVLPLFEKNANLSEDEKVIYKLLSKQNCYLLLQNCICKSVETLDTKSIYKAFVKNGLMARLQRKLTTKKLLELQK